MADRSIFTGMQLLLDRTWITNQALVVEEGKIKAIVPDNMTSHHLPAVKYEFSPEHYLIPGFIDVHIHGARGHDVMDGTISALQEISHALASEGVTGFLATTMTASPNQIKQVMEIIPAARESVTGAAILGIHLEGPFIAETNMGAQYGKPLAPSASLIKEWQAYSGNAIKMVTLAPELPQALELITHLSAMDIIASIGHTHATYAETEAAITAGCTHATHLFNAMRGLHQREPGPVTALLLSKNITAELIVDGHHLHPAIVELIYRIKGKDHLLLITDAMRAKCLGDGHYELGGQFVEVQAGIPSLANGTLAGSTLRLPEAIQNMVQFSKCTLIDAIEMATLNPARILGLDQSKGTLALGKDADIAVLNADAEVALTMRAGKVIFSR